MRIRMTLAWIMLCFLGAVVIAEAQPASKSFTKEEIKKMAETRAIIETKFGNMELKFFPDVAPNHVEKFIELVKKGFYNGTAFHRVHPHGGPFHGGSGGLQA